ncbi:CMAS family protein [Megaselia abdita]
MSFGIVYFLCTLLVANGDILEACPPHSNSSEFVALILARGGSKGIPRKNLAPIGRVSLLARAIQTIQRANVFNEIWVSTDDDEISNEAIRYGAFSHIRPESVSSDTATSIEAVQEFIGKHEDVKKVALFQCTSVFLREEYVRKAFEESQNVECIFSVTRSHKLRWKEVDGLIVPDNFNPEKRLRRQDWKGEMVEAGMVYVAERHVLEKGRFQSNKCRVIEIAVGDSMEIDTLFDLEVARCLIGF